MSITEGVVVHRSIECSLGPITVTNEGAVDGEVDLKVNGGLVWSINNLSDLRHFAAVATKFIELAESEGVES